MIQGKSVLALVPARGGSKGLPGKNIRPLCGKPLIAWTIEKALKSQYVDVVLVSTDSPEISAVAAQYGASVPFLRPPELATDTATSLSVVNHALDYYLTQQGKTFDYTLLLEPTSPLREDDDIDQAIAALDANANQFDALVTLGEVAEHPSIVKKLVDRRIQPFCPELRQTTRRQDNQPAYFPYGVAYLVKTATLQSEATFYTERCMGYKIKRYQHYEIDDLLDFTCVEAVMKNQWNLK